jgi:steroid 5-alpha reductase family enzyme
MLFIPIVQIPLLLTGVMAYVDIGWPWGLMLIAFNCMAGPGWWVRRYIVSSLMLLHGFRMSFGGAIAFGRMTNFTYIFKEDL